MPWRALQSQPVLMEMSDVWLCASPRQEEEWEETSAGQRAQASKQAELAARDLMRLSRPGSKGVAGAANPPEGSSSGWPFLSHLSAMLLNRLQMKVTNVHICFQVCSCCKKHVCSNGAIALVRRHHNHTGMCYRVLHALLQPLAVWQDRLRNDIIMHALSCHVAQTPRWQCVVQEPAQPGMQPLKFGLRLSSIQTEKVGKGSLGKVPLVRAPPAPILKFSSRMCICTPVKALKNNIQEKACDMLCTCDAIDLARVQGAQVIKDMRVDGLSIYWCPCRAPSEPPA